MKFIEFCSEALLKFIAGTVATTVGMAVTDVLGEFLDYIYISADTRYFVDYPNDNELENSMPNLIKRAKIHLKDLKKGKNYVKRDS